MEPHKTVARLQRELAREHRAHDIDAKAWAREREQLLKFVRYCDNLSLIQRSRNTLHDELVATKRMLERARALNRALHAETVVLAYRLGEPVRIGKDLLVRAHTCSRSTSPRPVDER